VDSLPVTNQAAGLGVSALPVAASGHVQRSLRRRRRRKGDYPAAMIEIPEDFARQVLEREGDPGRAWLASLPALVDELLVRWRCRQPQPITRGHLGIILPVQRHDGTPAVLKISFIHPANRYEPHALAVWGGRGAVLLYERDDATFAMLLEQAEWQTLEDLPDVDQATAVTGQLARLLAVPAPPDIPRLSDRADEWARSLRDNSELLGNPLSQRALGAAFAAINDLARKQPDTMIHGDLHFGNVVRAQREPWLVVDPSGLAGDLASDALQVLKRGAASLRGADDLEAELRRRLAIFADAAEIDRERAVRWAQAQAAMGAHHSRLAGKPAWIIQGHEQIAELLA
jgi:streptomycin 6-kinase